MVLPQKEGIYQLEVRVSGVDDRGEVFEYKLDNLQFNYSPGDDFTSMIEEPSKVEGSSSTAISSASSAPSEAAVEEEPEVEPEDDKESFPWLFYAGLGVGNLLLLGIGIFVFRKIVGATSDSAEDPAQEGDREPEAEVPDEAEADSVDAGVMEMEEAEDDEIPPMEDLEPDMDFEEDEVGEPEAAIEPEAKVEAEVEEPAPERIDEDFDFDLSAFDSGDGEDDDAFAASPEPEGEIEADLPVEEVAEDDELAPGPEVEAAEEEPPEEDMAQAMLKAQGLDLAEDELDDAISNLIDELDDDPEDTPKPADPNMAGEINLDDFDFDDDDDK